MNRFSYKEIILMFLLFGMLSAGRLQFGHNYIFDVVQVSAIIESPYDSYVDLTPQVYGRLIGYKITGEIYNQTTIKFFEEFSGEIYSTTISNNTIYLVNKSANEKVFGNFVVSIIPRNLQEYTILERKSFDENLGNISIAYSDNSSKFEKTSGVIKGAMRIYNLTLSTLELEENWTMSFWYRTNNLNNVIYSTTESYTAPVDGIRIKTIPEGLNVVINTTSGAYEQNISVNNSQWNNLIIDYYNKTLTIYLNGNKKIEYEVDEDLTTSEYAYFNTMSNSSVAQYMDIDEYIYIQNRQNINSLIDKLLDAKNKKKIDMKFVFSRMFN